MISITWLSLLVSSIYANRTLCDQYQSLTAWPYVFNNNAWAAVSVEQAMIGTLLTLLQG